MKRSLMLCALGLAGAVTATAQQATTGSLAGAVVDAQEVPVPGASVVAASREGEKSATTDATGRFFLPFLTPGRYTLTVELSGFAPVRLADVDVRLGQRVDLPAIVLRVGTLTEAVSVVAATPVIDTTSTTVGGVLDSDSLKRLPVGRQLTDALYLVAGVSDSSGLGRPNPSIGGASGLESAWLVDGVNITNTGYGGVGPYSHALGSLGSGVSTDFVKETQVKTAGFEAEYGQSTGGVVNVVTHSGTHRFHGSAFAYWRPGLLESDWRPLETPNGTVNTTARDEHDFGASFSGPAVRDKLFFFAALNPQSQNRTFIAPERSPLHAMGEQTRRRRVLSYAGKLTWQAGSSHRLDLSAFGDPAQGERGPQRLKALLAATDAAMSELDHYGSHSQLLKYDGILSRSWLVEALVARSTSGLEEVPAVDEHAVVDFTAKPTLYSGGLGFYDRALDGVSRQLQLRSTHIFDALGSHQLRLGGSFEEADFTRVYGMTGPSFVLPDGTRTRTGARVLVLPDETFGRVFRATEAHLGTPPETRQSYTSLFVQDTWQVGRRLTLRPGLRYEKQRLVGGGEPLCHADDTRPGRADGTGEAVPCAFTWDGNWAPRLGFTYDVRGDGRSKLFASWGRFFARIPSDLAVRALSADTVLGRADYFDPGLTRPVPDGVLAASTTRHFLLVGTRPFEIDPESRPTFLDEFVAGLELEPVRNLAGGLRYVHRSMPRVLEDVGTLPMVAYEGSHALGESVEYFITNPSRKTPVVAVPGTALAAFEDPRHVYDAVEIAAHKSWSDDWSLVASYRWSRLHGNFEGFYRSDNNQSDPAITSLFDFPTDDPSYSQVGTPRYGYRGDIRYLGCTLGCGVLPNDRTHQMKIYASRAFGAVNLGLGLAGGSGRPLTGLAASPQYVNGGEIPLTVRGAGMATLDGFRTRSPFEHTLDVHADYTFRVSDGRLVLLADVFNLANRQEPTDYDNWADLSFGVANPNFGHPVSGGAGAVPSFQAPRSVRLGARFEW
jgi:hypothetical protein